MKLEAQIKRRNKILAGLKLAYKRMPEFKYPENNEAVLMRDGKIAQLKP